MQKRLRKLFTLVKEHGSVSYAKAATAGGFCHIDLVIIRATTPDDLPLSERYVNELLKIFSISPTSFRTFSLSFVRRLGKTRCWRVALKCLLLLHRLLSSLPEDSAFRTELLWTRSNSLLSLYPCHFIDESSSNPEDYTNFIRSYAKLLDEALDCVTLDSWQTYDEEEMPGDLYDKMKEVGRMIEVLPQLQSLIDKVMECRPSGVAARNFIMKIAMKHIIRDSFIYYTTYRRDIVLVLDNLFQMPYRSCIMAFGIYKKAALQANQLCEFYDWCKATGFCGVYEYQFVDRVPQVQIQALETFLNGMWQLTESPSSTSSPSSLLGSSTLTATLTEEDGDYKQIVKKDIVVISDQWEKFEEDAGFARYSEGKREMEALTQLEETENDNWEDILDASVDLTCSYVADGGTNEWEMQIYNPQAVNPFNHPRYTPCYFHGLYQINPTNQWKMLSFGRQAIVAGNGQKLVCSEEEET